MSHAIARAQGMLEFAEGSPTPGLTRIMGSEKNICDAMASAMPKPSMDCVWQLIGRTSGLPIPGTIP